MLATLVGLSCVEIKRSFKMSEWVSVGTKKTARKRPVAKRRPLPLPPDATQLDEVVYAFLVKSFPEPRLSEDILADLIKSGFDAKIEDVWAVLDSGVLSSICDETRPGRLFVLKAK